MKTETMLIIAGSVAAFTLLNKGSSGSFGQAVGNAIGEGVVSGSKDVIVSAKDVAVGVGGANVWDPGKIGTVQMPKLQIYDLLNPFTYTLKQAKSFWDSVN